MARPHVQKVRDELLEYLVTYQAQHGYAPSFKEIGEAIDRDRQSVRQHLEALHADGRIVYRKGVSRGLTINEPRGDA